jgi:formate hydrogenlyase subunit 6/NADH:ubiquinone oxidoreductase subunit I
VGCIILGLPDKKNKTAYPELINANGCISCGFCAKDCPVDAIVLMPPSAEDQTEAA